MVTRTDYNQIAVKAAYSVMLEISRILGEYRDNMVLIGGWVPQLLFQNKSEMHIGSIDVDLAFNHKRITNESYRSIQDLLLERNYEQSDQLFIFRRKVNIEGTEVIVKVDLLSGEYEGTGRSHRHQRIHDIHAHKVRGCDLAFEEITDEEDRIQMERDAFERINYLLKKLGIV